jgi:hypothetical protein
MFLFFYLGSNNFHQTTAKATEFYNAKVKDLEANLTDLEKILQGKSGNLRVIEDSMFLPLLYIFVSEQRLLTIWPALRQKVMSGEAVPTSAG